MRVNVVKGLAFGNGDVDIHTLMQYDLVGRGLTWEMARLPEMLSNGIAAYL
jgi:hypothetical protein